MITAADPIYESLFVRELATLRDSERALLESFVADAGSPPIDHLRVHRLYSALGGVQVRLCWRGRMEYITIRPAHDPPIEVTSSVFDFNEGDVLTDPGGGRWRITEIEHQDFSEAIVRIEAITAPEIASTTGTHRPA